MFITSQIVGTAATITLRGSFGFSEHRDFRKAVKEQLAGPCTVLEIDFDGVDYLDSSALGSLLLSREEAGAAGKSIVLVNCRGTVKQIIDIANFHRLFTIR